MKRKIIIGRTGGLVANPFKPSGLVVNPFKPSNTGHETTCSDPKTNNFATCGHLPEGPQFWEWIYEKHPELIVALKSRLIEEVELNWPE